MNISKARRRVLIYLRDNGPIGIFPMPLVNLRRAQEAGQVESCGREPGMFGFTKYRLTESGKQALCPGNHGESCCLNSKMCEEAMAK